MMHGRLPSRHGTHWRGRGPMVSAVLRLARVGSCAVPSGWLVAVFLLCLLGCGRSDTYPNRPITLICPWGRGGGTDRVSRQMAEFLTVELGVPVNVINATGGKGVTGHSRGLRARPDGYTIAMITSELNMMHWSGLTRLTYQDCEPLMSINEDYCALFVRTDAPWRDLEELEEAIRQNPGHLKASGTASGGSWHLALAGWLITKGMSAEDVIWVSSTGANPSLQELMSGGYDMVACSLPEARTLMEAGQVRAIGVMAPRRAEAFPDVKTFAEQGTNWTLAGWRGLAVPKGTPQPIADRLRHAIGRIVRGQTKLELVIGTERSTTTFPEFMASQGFDSTWRTKEDFRQFMKETDAKLGHLLTSDAMRSVNTDRFDPMAFPRLLLIALGLTAIGIIEESFRFSNRKLGYTVQADARGLVNFACVIGAIIVYMLIVETVGFVLSAGGILLGLLWRFGTRPWLSLVIALLFTPLVYQLFANLLRVPLPRGWLGW